MITKGEFYFATPDTLNDPLDCAFYMEQVLNKIKSDSDQEFINKFEEIATRSFNDKVTEERGSVFQVLKNRLSQLGVLSLSKRADEPLMWSHYANGHKGITVGIRKEYFESMKDSVCRDLKIIGGFNVEYEESPNYLEIIDWYVKREIKTKKQIKNEHLLVGLLIAVIITKSKSWLYESEFRVIRHSKGALTIPAEYISEVVVGNKTTDVTFSEIERILDSPSLRHIEIKKAEFSKYSFAMTISDT